MFGLLRVVNSVCEGREGGPDIRVIGVFTEKHEADKCVRRVFEAYEIQGYTKVESWHGGSYDPKGYNPGGFRVTIRDGVRVSVSAEVVQNVTCTLGQWDSNLPHASIQHEQTNERTSKEE